MERKTYNLFDIIYSGTAKYLERAEKDVAKAIEEKGRDAEAKLPDTAYGLATIYAITGEK